MNLEAPMPCLDSAPASGRSPDGGRVEPGEIELLLCIRSLGGWVGPGRMASRETLDGLAARGLLEVWPGRPLYRVPQGSGS